MARKQEWTVRVVNYHRDNHGVGKIVRNYGQNELPSMWLEQLRYMGFAKELADYEDRNVLEFYAPRGADSRIWADQNAARMRSFGIDAAAAPKWDNDRYQGDHTETKQGQMMHLERLNRGQ